MFNNVITNLSQKFDNLLPSDITFSFDLESTGLLHEVKGNIPYLLEIGIVPFSPSERKVYDELSLKLIHKVPGLKQMKEEGKISDFVLKNKKLLKLVEEASILGLETQELKDQIRQYTSSFKRMNSGISSPILTLSKSSSGLDRELMNQTLGHQWVEDNFRHKIIDLTSCEQLMGWSGHITAESALEQFTGLTKVPHRALEDSIIFANQMIAMVEYMSKLSQG